MASPVKPSDICATVPSPTASICDKLKKFFALPGLLCSFFEWLLDSNGNPTEGFKQTLISLGIPVGGVIWFPLNSVPSGYLVANGQSVNRTTYAALYAVYGTTFGSSDATTFKVPDLQGRFLIGAAGAHVVGDVGGGESSAVTLTESQLPVHSHEIGVDGAGVTSDSEIGKLRVGGSAIDWQATAGTKVGYTRETGAGAVVNVPILPPFQVGLWLVKT